MKGLCDVGKVGHSVDYVGGAMGGEVVFSPVVEWDVGVD